MLREPKSNTSVWWEVTTDIYVLLYGFFFLCIPQQCSCFYLFFSLRRFFCNKHNIFCQVKSRKYGSGHKFWYLLLTKRSEKFFFFFISFVHLYFSLVSFFCNLQRENTNDNKIYWKIFIWKVFFSVEIYNFFLLKNFFFV